MVLLANNFQNIIKKRSLRWNVANKWLSLTKLYNYISDI